MTTKSTSDAVRQADVSTPGRRIQELDSLRGFALCGILIINIYQQVVFAGAPAGRVDELPTLLQLAFYERFYPIFAVLFGVGFGIFLRRAGQRTERPRSVLARRLAILLVIGILHQLLHPGEALVPYALAGFLVLLPMSYLGGRAALVVAVLLVLVGSQIVLGYGPIPGLLALGYALAALGVPETIGRATGWIAVGFGAFGAIAVTWVALRLTDVALPWVNVIGGLGGGVSLLPVLGAISTALAYCCGLLLLLRTPLGPALSGVLAPMGRMALTNYLSATVLFLFGGWALGVDSPADLPRIVGLTAGILVVQAVWSARWLRSFRYGPAEWVWRSLTWWTRAPFRR